MAATAAIYGFPANILPSIHSVEGGKVGTIAHNKNGTDDLGFMQVNSSWLPALVEGTGLPASTLRTRLIQDPCFNIAMAGSILDLYRQEAHGDVWRAVGFYHSHTPPLGLGYQAQVLNASIASMLTPQKQDR
ncbi:lytic transglycosylase domain-containing protein [Komagataeibacter europaeus]|uniref:lytic transglycosylase domain-containing protein n=1 Tax=Komagataeibacter europaeus TaxID=33995 RepID=UPI000362964E|nr:lytic transglycosylase domain-containing protein [Komagataeibacter europaeus]GBQ46958.1 BfpH protein [Komagataeibacter europaeus LMG 18890]